MNSHPTPSDISKYPDLVRIVEEAEAAKTPRELTRDDKIVAILVPTAPTKANKWKKIHATFGSWSDLPTDEMIEKTIKVINNM